MLRWKDNSKTVLVTDCKATHEMVDRAREALAVQDAANAAAVVHTFARVMDKLMSDPQNTAGTDWASQHPLVHLYIDKLASLARYEQTGDLTRFNAAWDLSQEKDITFEITPIGSSMPYWRHQSIPIMGEDDGGKTG